MQLFVPFRRRPSFGILEAEFRFGRRNHSTERAASDDIVASLSVSTPRLAIPGLVKTPSTRLVAKSALLVRRHVV